MSQSHPSLLCLAPELIENVIRQVSDSRDLAHIRLCSRALSEHATKELFKDVFLSPDHSSIQSWLEISQHEVLRYIPRKAIIHTQPDTEDHGMGVYRERDEDNAEEFEEALAALQMFPNVESVEIAFTPECIGSEDHDWLDVSEDIWQREASLQDIFDAIKTRSTDASNRKIRTLTILNLQNYPLKEFTSSQLFKDVMVPIENLHISITQQINEHGPDHDYTKIELRTFPAYFITHWLAPISSNLKSLSLYNRTDNWGPFPGYFDPSALSFPKLETLALGYYTLAHEGDFDWVLRIKSLRKLILHNCVILSWIRVYGENAATWGLKTHGWEKLVHGGGRAEKFSYDGSWNRVFDDMSRELPQLADFRFGFGFSYEEPAYGIQHRESCGTEIFPQRYICFNNGILPTHWLEADDDGNMLSWLDEGFPKNVHKENLEADAKSLQALLEILRARKSVQSL